MAEYTIPEPQQPSLNKVRTIQDSTLQELISAWERSPLDIPSVDGLSVSDVSKLRDAVLELYRVREYYDEKVPEFAVSIAAALQKSSGFPAAEVPALENRLTRLLTLPPLSIVAKAESLSTEYERRFCAARILTDARPIYIDKPSAKPDAVVITHTLRITFHDDTGEMRETYITMDDDDLTTLRELIDRAEEKAKSLQSVFATANIQTVAL